MARAATVAFGASLVIALTPIAAMAAPPNISVNDVSVAEGDSGTVDLVFTVSYGGPATTVTVDYTTADATATAGVDYTAASGVATIGPSKSTTVTVIVDGDLIDELDETFELNLSNNSSGNLTDPQGIGTITDDDLAPNVSVDAPTAGEADGTLTYTLSLDAPSSFDVTVDHATADGTAVDGEDYMGAGGTATILAGDTAATVDVAVLDDLVYEGDEDLTLTMTNPSNATLGTDVGTGTIADDEPFPELSIDDVATAEGDAGSVTATFTVTLSQVSATDVTADVASADVEATDGVDYAGVATTVTVASGDTAATVDVSVLGDTIDEATETYTVDLANGSGATIADAQGVGSITDDDATPTTVTARLRKTKTTVVSKGLLEPSVAGLKIKVSFQRKVSGTWQVVATKTVTVSKLGDRDGDTLTDAAYKAAFTRPTKKGSYRFVARFLGNATYLASSATKGFTL